MSNQLYDLSIVRSKLVIKQLREITLHDLVAVRETLNSIDFILGDDDAWEYDKLSRGWRATTKVRLFSSEEIMSFLKDNKDKIQLSSIDHAFITDLTQVYKVEVEGKSEQEIRVENKDKLSDHFKKDTLESINEAVGNINMLADTMGDIL